MNLVIDTIKARRTTRAFKSGEQIKEKFLNEILEAGTWAPTGHNLQPWFFTAIQNEELIIKLSNLSKEAGKASKDSIIQKMCNNVMLNLFYGAPTVVIISYHKDAVTPVEDVAAATQNMLLAAESLDISSCWNGIVGFYFSKISEKEKEEFGIPKDFIPYNAIALGYPKIKVMNTPARNKVYSKIIK